MGKTYTIPLSDEDWSLVGQYAREAGMSEAGFLRDVIRRWLLLRRFGEVRKKMVPHAEAQGIHTDEDVFRLLSRGSK